MADFLKARTRIKWTKVNDQYITSKMLAGDKFVKATIDMVTNTISIANIDPYEVLWTYVSGSKSVLIMKLRAKKALKNLGVNFYQEKRIVEKKDETNE